MGETPNPTAASTNGACRSVGNQLEQAYGAHMAVPAWLTAMVEDGLLGKKSGAGFYHFAETTPTINAAANQYYGGSPQAEREFDANMGERSTAMTSDAIVLRCLLPMVIESLRCLQEKVVSSADQLDAAMIFGVGGPLHDFGNHHDYDAIVKQAESWGLNGIELLKPWIEMLSL